MFRRFCSTKLVVSTLLGAFDLPVEASSTVATEMAGLGGSVRRRLDALRSKVMTGGALLLDPLARALDLVLRLRLIFCETWEELVRYCSETPSIAACCSIMKLLLSD